MKNLQKEDFDRIRANYEDLMCMLRSRYNMSFEDSSLGECAQVLSDWIELHLANSEGIKSIGDPVLWDEESNGKFPYDRYLLECAMNLLLDITSAFETKKISQNHASDNFDLSN